MTNNMLDINKLTVVVPVYRSANSLVELHDRIVSVMEMIKVDFEIIFVEDCGGDNSWDVISELAAADVRVVGIKLSRNYGQHNAILAGIRRSGGDIIVTVDDDLQHPPEEIPKLITKLVQGYDVVYGTPERLKHGIIRDMASHITKVVLQGAMGAETARNISAFRAFKTQVRDAFASYNGPSVNVDVLLTWGTTHFGCVSVRHSTRQYGESGYTARKLFNHAWNMITGFSTIPLRFSSLVGITFTIFGIMILIFVLYGYFFGDRRVPGFAFIASIVAIFSGAQLLALGIIGEYLGRMYQRSMDRPTYVVKRTTIKS